MLLVGQAEDALDACPVVPAAIEDHDFAGDRELLDVALQEQLGAPVLGRRAERDDAEHARR